MKKEKWFDESGNEIPASRITALEKTMEAASARILKKAQKLNTELVQLKNEVHSVSEGLFVKVMKQNDVDISKRKGNFSWFNFDRSVKIEISVNERVVFDDMLMKAAKEKLFTFIDEQVPADISFIKDLITEAFQTRNGKLDTKRVMQLVRYKKKIKHQLFRDAVDLIESSIRKPDSKIYSRIWVRNDQGEYENVELNYSSI
ncbi:MAG: DUF3164 family protein [Ignavibacteriales bacterium]|nr:MAG: DUF3164 family protein [Ignavibacteriales bacterium]